MSNADLRPMTIGEVLDRTFKMYKSDFWLFAGIMSFPFMVLFVFNVGIAWLTMSQAAAVRAGASGPSFSPSLIITGASAALLLLILTFVLTGIGQAATVFAVSDVYLGRTASIRNSFRQVRGHVLQAVGTIFLTGLAVGAGFIALIIPGVIILCRTGVAVPAAMLEDIGPGMAISRSFELTKSFAMQMFVIFLLAFALAIGVAMVFTMPFTFLAAYPAPHVLPFGFIVLQDASSFVAQVIAAPVQTIAFSLMYYNLRVRKEGFDLEHLIGSLGTPAVPNLPGPGEALPS